MLESGSAGLAAETFDTIAQTPSLSPSLRAAALLNAGKAFVEANDTDLAFERFASAELTATDPATRAQARFDTGAARVRLA
ncbi:MAG: hypothetical protein AAF235_08810, partial [Planctomycetota bacterium]